MDMETIKGLMKEVGWGDLATTDGQQVGVRPMAGWAWFGSELWCATGDSSDKIAQLRKVPHAEYCFGKPDGTHVRIAGPCTVSDDSEDKLKLHQACALLKDHIEDPADPEYVVIRMQPDRVRMMVPPEQTYTDVELA